VKFPIPQEEEEPFAVAAAEGHDLSGHLSNETLAPLRERPPQFRGTRTDSIAAISHRANSAVAVTRHAPGDRLELLRSDKSQISPRPSNRPSPEESWATANATRRRLADGAYFRCQMRLHGIPET
jgi:hypothetical protein